MARSPLVNLGLSLAGQVGARAVALVFFGALARRFGTEPFGTYGLGTSVGTLAAIAVEPGLNHLLVRDGVREPEALPRRLAQALAFKLLAALAMGGLLALAVPLFAVDAAESLRLWLAAATILLVPFEDLFAAALVARERQDLESALRVASKLLGQGFGLAALALGASFDGVLGAWLLGSVATGLFGAWQVARQGIPLRLSLGDDLSARLREAAPLALTGALWLVTLRLDQLLASWQGLPRAEAGALNGAVKLVEALLVLPNSLGVVFQPLLVRSGSAGPQALGSTLSLASRTASTVLLPVALGGAALAGPLATFVYGEGFGATGPLLAVQLAMLPLAGLQFVSFHALVAVGALKAQSRAWAAALAVNLTLNLLLVPRLGALGVSLAAVAGTLACAVACNRALAARQVPTRWLAEALKPALLAGAMALAVDALQGRVPFPVALAAGGLLYAGLQLATGGRALIDELRATRAAPATAAATSSPQG